MIKTYSSLCAKALFIFFLFFASPVFGLEIPSKPAGHVTDLAGMLSPETRQHIEETLADFETKTSNQIAVVIFPGLEGESLEDFSIRLAEKWKIGQKGRDNGVILLIFRDDRELRIEVGYGLEGALPDALAGQIIQQVIVPHFRQGQFEQGITAGVVAIMQAIQGEFAALPLQTQTVDISSFARWIMIFLAGLLLIDFARFGFYRTGQKTYNYRYGFWEWFVLFSILLLVLKVLLEVLLRSGLSSRGGYYGNNRGFGGSSGGFSGGGGSFGGGGASGRW